MQADITKGFLVETVEPGSPAEKLGLHGGSFPMRFGTETYVLGGSVIDKVNGVSVGDMKAVRQIIGNFKVGDTVTVQYYDDRGKLMEDTVQLPERPALPGDLR